ncbi:hypothetical protein [Streptomyces sp. NPDC058664]|uniref:hypothetical protein n=1 Tax=unclassified Streptomyces TaxID=2593676 RepID=UPI003659C644
MTQPSSAEARAYDNLYAELTRGVSHAQVRHHLIEEYRAAVLREAAAEAERENAHCPPLTASPCQPCAVRTAVAAKLRRMVEEASS